MHKYIQIVYSLIFLILLLGIIISTLFNVGVDSVSEYRLNERRFPEKQPVWKWKVEAVKIYFDQLESFINDRFALRTELNSLYSTILYELGVSSRPEKIVVGKNNFLFLGNDFQKVIDQITGEYRLSNEKLVDFQYSFSLRQDYLNQYNIPLYITIVPNKHSIYSEYLPDHILYSEDNTIRQLMNYVSDLKIINLHDTLRTVKKIWGEYLYGRTDSHWSSIGAYIGYRKILDVVKCDFKKVTPFIIEDDEFVYNQKDGSDLRRMLKLFNNNPDHSFSLKKDVHDRTENIIKYNSEDEKIPIKPLEIVDQREIAVVKNEKQSKTLLIFRDSQTNAMSGFLNQTFGKVVYCHYSFIEAFEFVDLVEKYKPDLVIFEFGERVLIQNWPYHSKLILENPKYNFKSVLKMDSKYLQSTIQQINNLELYKTGLKFNSLGNNPNLLLPKFNPGTGRKTAIKIDITVPQSGLILIYYLAENQTHFSNQHMLKNICKQGKNSVTFLFTTVLL